MRIHWEINIIPYRERKFNSRFIDFFIEDIDIFDIMHIVELIMKDRSNKKEILTDVLMSPEKLFFMKKNPKEDLLQSIPWSDITIEKNGTLLVKFELNYHRYEVKFDFNHLPNFESESNVIQPLISTWSKVLLKKSALKPKIPTIVLPLLLPIIFDVLYLFSKVFDLKTKSIFK